MTYKFNDKNYKKIVNMIISIAPLPAVLLMFVYKRWATIILAFLISAFDFYYTRSIYRKQKIRIKELFITDGTIKLSYVYKSKDPLILKKTDYDTTINEGQITLTKKGEHVMLGIANKDDMDEPEKWTDLIADLTF